jgi:GTPase Era involved in 16S rRNA processing
MQHISKPHLLIVGKPQVGKITLLNKILNTNLNNHQIYQTHTHQILN